MSEFEAERQELREQVEELRRCGRITIDAGERMIATLRNERDLLRAALVGLVGVDSRAELEQLEAVMRLMAAPAEDKAATIDAIHALVATLAEPQSVGAVDPHVDSTGKLSPRDKKKPFSASPSRAETP